jgi:hypothetical protein
MARRIKVVMLFDLAKHSKDAHNATIKPLADAAGEQMLKSLDARGYKVTNSTVRTVMEYVRHDSVTTLRKAVKRSLRSIS